MRGGGVAGAGLGEELFGVGREGADDAKGLSLAPAFVSGADGLPKVVVGGARGEARRRHGLIGLRFVADRGLPQGEGVLRGGLEGEPGAQLGGVVAPGGEEGENLGGGEDGFDRDAALGDEVRHGGVLFGEFGALFHARRALRITHRALVVAHGRLANARRRLVVAHQGILVAHLALLLSQGFLTKAHRPLLAGEEALPTALDLLTPTSQPFPENQQSAPADHFQRLLGTLESTEV